MRILLVHNYYQQPGGEDVVFSNDHHLLEMHGHTVESFIVSNAELHKQPNWRAAADTIWSTTSYTKLLNVVRHFQPDIVHFHNTFMRLSPACYHACRVTNTPIVQTLHNYRLLCPSATMLRNGQACEACLGHRLPLAGIRHGCYRQSRAQTSVVAMMLATHWLLGTWHQLGITYLALTEFARQKFIEGGLPATQIIVRPNFLPDDPGPKADQGNYALFVGRISEEKGVQTLLNAWQQMQDVPLKIVGDGPLYTTLATQIAEHSLHQVELLGYQGQDEVIELMKGARFLVFPSKCYEGLPMTLVEAAACGLPVIASNLGAMTEIIADGKTGLHFAPTNAADLADKVQWAWNHPSAMLEMGHHARAYYENRYIPQQSYDQLMTIYEQVIAAKQTQSNASAKSSNNFFQKALPDK